MALNTGEHLVRKIEVTRSLCLRQVSCITCTARFEPYCSEPSPQTSITSPSGSMSTVRSVRSIFLGDRSTLGMSPASRKCLSARRVHKFAIACAKEGSGADEVKMEANG